MDLPCPDWISHAEQIWSRLDPEQTNKFSGELDIDEIFDFGQSQTTPDDVRVLSGIGRNYPVQKCAPSAAKLRERGNDRFKAKDYTSAALLYSQGVCHAPENSEQLALCYANRSAALFQLARYQECVEDVGRALAHGYPSHLQPKLLSRRDQCQGFICPQQPGQERGTAAPTAHHTPSPAATVNHPHTHTPATGVSLHFSLQKGRHLVAMEGKSAGEVLLEDQAFSCVLIQGEGLRAEQEGRTEREIGVAEGAKGAFGTEDRCCHRCLCPTLCPVPCPGCSYERYCGQRCQQEAWQEHHRWECPLGAELRATGFLAHLALRVALKGGLQQVRRARGSEVKARSLSKQEVAEEVEKESHDGKDNTFGHNSKSPPGGQIESVLPSSAFTQMSALSVGCPGDAYQHVHSLLPHVEGHAPSLRFLYAVTIATLHQALRQAGPPPASWGGGDYGSDSCDGPSACEDAVGGAWNPELSILGATALRHLLQLRANAQAITTERVSDECGTAVQASREIRVATAIFPTLSLLNHACRPNTSVTFDTGCGGHAPDGTLPSASSPDSVMGVSVLVRAARDLTAGEELLHCYGPHCSRMEVQERQRLLLEQYLFRCQCEACLQDLQSPPEGYITSTHYKCPKCARPLQAGAGGYVCARKGCSGQVSGGEVEKTLQVITAVLDQALELLDMDRPVEALRLLQEATCRSKRHLLATNRLQGALSDATARAYASMGDWCEAASHLGLSVASVRCQFGEDSVEVGQQLFKLTQLHFNGGQAGQALSVLAEARRVLSLYLHAHSQELQDLRGMEDCLRATL
ncbi:SET and MYND domain-containing protein 4 [Clupea harengus]|uniref:Protein-lysine N-methyltransferase SMYD4 n=1 Tax=Clupea harengus TaxID=7950 RepID=A0A6P3VH24_CLUHA|nr:SET and MYND domain-containing protein 4 [Clupea harengus]